MTLTNLQTILHALYTGDSTTPDSSDAEYTVRTTYLNAAINIWESEFGMLWTELFTTLQASATGDKTITASTTAYDAPDDFKFLGGYVETYSDADQKTKWQVVPAEKATVKDGDGIVGLSDGYVWVTGNMADGYTINFSSQPTVGDTIDYPFYKVATTLSDGSDALEMSDGYFAIYFALSKLHEQDGEGDRATFAMSMAETKMTAMKTLNAMAPPWQLNGAENSTLFRTGQGFGL